MTGELATPEELAAREKRAAADRPGLPPFEALAAATDRLTDDDLASRLEGLTSQAREVLLEILRRIPGPSVAEPEPEPGDEDDGPLF